MPEDVRTAVGRLVQVPIDVDYVAETLPSDSHWTYDPDEKKSYHRILLRSNFCSGSKGYWTETNSSRAVGDGSSDGSGGPGFRHRNEYAYPRQHVGQAHAGGHDPRVGQRETGCIRWGVGASGNI